MFNTGQEVAAMNEAVGYQTKMYQYTHCKPCYQRVCQPDTDATEAKGAEAVRNSKRPTLWHPNPFAPHGGSAQFCSNDLLLHDVNMRRMARVRPLDCGLTQMIQLNPEPQL